MSELNDPRRIIGNILRLGTIESVDLGEATCRVRVGENVTGDIAWWTPRAGDVRVWSPPSTGEQCLLFCAEGDTEAGIAVTGLFSDAHPAPTADPMVLIEFKDGTRMSYDYEAHALKIEMAAGGTGEVTAPGGLTIEANVAITGNVSIDGDVSIDGKADATGKITSDDDIVGGGKSLKTHKHTGVQPGGGVSGTPQ